MIAAQMLSGFQPIVLIAGGASFVGSFLSEALLLQNCRVICIDNLSKGKKENLKKCLGNPNFQFFNYDLTHSLPEAITTQEISYIFDLVGKEKVTYNLWELAKNKKAKLLILTSEKFSWEGFPKEFFGVDFRIVYLKNVYGPRMDPKQMSLLREKIYHEPYIFISDAIFGITKAMFSPGTRGGIFYLTPEGERRLGWTPKIEPAQGLVQTLKFLGKKEIKREEKTVEKSSKISRKIFSVFAVFLLVFLIQIFLFLGDIILGINNLRQAEKEFRKIEFQKAVEKSEKAEFYFKRAKREISYLKMGYSLEKYLLVGEELSAAIKEGGLMGKNFLSLVDSIFQKQQNEAENLEELILRLRTHLEMIYYYLSMVEGRLRETEKIKYLNFSKREISEIRDLIQKTKKGLEVLPWAIGLGEKRTYLILFQNNSELRPTGGFIGSFALLSFENGKFVDLEVQDVYWADGQLKGHVEPPPELKRYLGEANWYFRDANWDPDFPTTAKRAQWFLEKETGRRVEGVIGINLLVAQQILQAIGEVSIPDYQEKINAANLFERAEYHSEIGTFPGSTQKQDFLGSLSRILWEEFRNAPKDKKIKVIQAFYRSLENKDVLVFLENSQSMEVISQIGWDGRIREIRCISEDQGCLNDYLFIVEANVGVNKANYFVKREINHRLTISSDGEIKEALQIVYKNDSPSEHFPGGKYKNYLRILVPQESELEKILVNQTEIEKEKIEVSEISNKKTFGFLVEVPIKEERIVDVFYRRKDPITITGKSQYLFLVQKQSGIKEENFNLTISVSSPLKIIPLNMAGIINEGNYYFSPQFNKDLLFEMYLVR